MQYYEYSAMYILEIMDIAPKSAAVGTKKLFHLSEKKSVILDKSIQEKSTIY